MINIRIGQPLINDNNTRNVYINGIHFGHFVFSPEDNEHFFDCDPIGRAFTAPHLIAIAHELNQLNAKI